MIATCLVSIKGFLLALLGLTTKCKTSMFLDNFIKKQYFSGYIYYLLKISALRNILYMWTRPWTSCDLFHHALMTKQICVTKGKKNIWFGPLEPYRVEAKPGTSQAPSSRQLFTSGSEPKTALPTSVSRAGDLLCNAWDYQTAKHAGCRIIWGQRR